MAPGEPGSSWLYGDRPAKRRGELPRERPGISCPTWTSAAPRKKTALHLQTPGSRHPVREAAAAVGAGRLAEGPVGGRRVLCRARRGAWWGQHWLQPHAKAKPPCLGTVNSPAPSKPPRRVPKQQERVLLCCFKLKSLRFVELSAAGGNKTVHRLIVEMRQFTTDASPPVEAARA